MEFDPIIKRRGEFLQEYYGNKSQYFSLSCIGSRFPHSLRISFVSYGVCGHYRGEDSGAIYSEFGDANPIVTYEIPSSVYEDEHYGIKVSLMLERLFQDKANWTPLDRHFDIVSFLIERQDLIVYIRDYEKEHFIKRCAAISSYADLNFFIPTTNRSFYLSSSLNVIKKGISIAQYDVNEIRPLLSPRPKNIGIWSLRDLNSSFENYSHYPVFYNFDLICCLRDNPRLQLSCSSFDNFALFTL